VPRFAGGGALFQGARRASTRHRSRPKGNVAGRIEKRRSAGRRYVDKGLKYAAPTGPRIEQILIADPLLLRTPIVRAGSRATVGYAAEVWQGWIDEAKRG